MPVLDFSTTSATAIAQLEEILARFPVRECEETVQRGFDLIHWLGQPAHLVPVLEEALTEQQLLAEVAGRSYRHVNHFDKIVLVGNDKVKGYRLTLHLWSPPYTEDQLQEELIHDHRFSFWSTVLAGAQVSENFERSPSGSVFREYHYIPEVRKRDFLDFYEFQGETRLAKTETIERCAGDSYYLSGPAIHQVLLPRDGISCTLVLRGPRVRGYAIVFNTGYPKDNTQFDNSMFSESRLAEKLRRLLDALPRDSP